MTKLTFYIMTILLAVSAYPNNKLRVTEDLHKDFTEFSLNRLKKMIEVVREKETIPEFLTVSVTLTDCSNESSAHVFSEAPGQLTWEERSCGTSLMREWCDELPGQSVNLMSKDPNSKTSFMSHFQCELPLNSTPTSTNNTRWPQLVIPGLVLICVLGILYNFRKLCREQAERRRQRNMTFTVNHTFAENSNMDAEKRTHIRFSETSDPSIGKVFTL